MFTGLVIRGEEVARNLGYPTANLDIHPKATKLRDGVYAAYATVRGHAYKCALVIQTPIHKVEVYLFDYAGSDFYGVAIDVDPIQKVSEIEPLADAALKAKIESDIHMIREALEKDEL